MARVAVLGANGKLGQELVSRAIDVGHRVHAWVRDLAKFKRQNESLTVYGGPNADALDAAVEGCQYVISAVDPGGQKVTEFVTLLTNQLAGRKLKRLVFISRLGVGNTVEQAQQASGLLSGMSLRLMRADYEDIARAESVLRVSKLPYLILRTTRLTDAPLWARVVTTDAKNPPPSRVGRADLAKFIVEVMEREGYDRKELTVGAERT